jgi:hypothetical protein
MLLPIPDPDHSATSETLEASLAQLHRCLRLASVLIVLESMTHFEHHTCPPISEPPERLQLGFHHNASVPIVLALCFS